VRCAPFYLKQTGVMNTKKTAESTANHEAGHAAVAWRLAVPFRYVTVVPEPGSLGHMAHQCPKWFRPDLNMDRRTLLRLQDHMIISFAGQIAETLYRGRRPRFGYDSDNRSAVDMAFRAGGSEKTVNALLRYCWCASEDTVNFLWQMGQIQSLAKALLDRKRLNHEEVIELFAPGATELRNRLAKATTARPRMNDGHI
jgi:hypothetical protein